MLFVDKVNVLYIITARGRSTREGNVFTGVCLFTFWGVPHPADGRGYPIPGPGREGTQSQVSRWGVPHVPHPVLDGGAPPHQGLDWMGYPPIKDWMGYPLVQTWDGVSPPIQTWYGVSSLSKMMGYPPRPFRRWSSIASTCYMAGSMPLSFTQEDFLVLLEILLCFWWKNIKILLHVTMLQIGWMLLVLNCK